MHCGLNADGHLSDAQWAVCSDSRKYSPPASLSHLNFYVFYWDFM